MLHKEFVNNPTAEELWNLSKDSVEQPLKAIYQFFDTYGLGSPHERLWQMLKLTLSSKEVNDWNEVQRENSIHFYEMLLALIKSNYVLFLKMRKEL
ncbi:MAG TPA: hypothetical protein VFW07_25150 [Parafilimonas sp.]|nr:hypothetical protein [Parafilimonas sp.]